MATIEERAKEYAAQSINIGADEMTYRDAASEQRKIDIEKLKDIMNRLMLDTKDKAEIIKAMEE